MISIYEVLFILYVHYVADFIFQDEKWALGKSKNWKDLLSHTVVYSMIWFLVAWKLDLMATFLFVGITFVLHTATDYITSRIVSKKFAEKKIGSAIPNFGAFSIIGFDQIIHYSQLFLTYLLLK